MRVLVHMLLCPAVALVFTTCAQRTTLDREFVDPKTKVVPSGLTYAANPAVYVQGAAIANNTPSLATGASTSYSIQPALSAGLSLDTTTGALTGTPSEAKTLTNYTVTAKNDAGQTSTVLTITVRSSPQLEVRYPSTACSPCTLNFGSLGTNTPGSHANHNKTVTLHNAGVVTTTPDMNWTISSPSSYVTFSANSGSLVAQGAAASVVVYINTTGLSAGNYNTTATVSSADPGIVGSPVTINISFSVSTTYMVAVGANGYVYQGALGGNWTLVNSSGAALTGAVYANGYFYAVRANQLIRSGNADGSGTWISRATIGSASFDYVQKIAYGNSRFALAGYRNVSPVSGKVWYSTTADSDTAFTEVAMSGTYSHLYGLAYAGSFFVAVGGNSGPSPNIEVTLSSDGTTWNGVDVGPASADANTGNLADVAFGNDKCVAAGGFSIPGIIASSNAACSTWPNMTSGNYHNPGFTPLGVIYDGTQFVIVGTGGNVITSATGGTPWTSRKPSGTTTQFNSIAYKGGYWIVVGQNGETWATNDITNSSAWVRRCAVDNTAAACTSANNLNFIALGP